MSAFSKFINSCKTALKGVLAHPVLLVILCHAWIVTCIEDAGNPVMAPIFAFLSVFVDRLCKGKGWSWILVPLYVGSCYIEAHYLFDGTVAFAVICAAILPLCYLWVKRDKEDIPFIRQAGATAWSILIALVSVTVIAGVSALILTSIESLFDADVDGLLDWTLYFCYIVLLAPVFISIDENRQTDGHSRTLEAIINWVMTPALIIYTLVLYAYCIKIVASWTLPDGQVAYMTLAFFIILFICRTYRNIQEKKPFEWFYRYSWAASIPLFILFWVGTFRRLSDYGCTSARYYLLLSGIILMILVIRRERKNPSAFYHYFCMALSAIFLLSIICPGISHKDISMHSQRNIAAREAARLGLLGADGRFEDRQYECSDSLEAISYRRIYQALLAMNDMDSDAIGKSFGIENLNTYLFRLPNDIQQFAVNTTVPFSSEMEDDGIRILSRSDRSVIETCGFNYVRTDTNVRFDRLQKLGLDLTEENFIEKQAIKCGWEGPGHPSFLWLSDHRDQILTAETDDFRILISSLTIKFMQKDSTWKVENTWLWGDILFNDKGVFDTLNKD